MAPLGWARATSQIETAARLLIALRRYFYSRGFPADGQKWVQQLLPDVPALDSVTQAEFLLEAARMTLGLDIKMALSYSEQAARLLRPLNDRSEVGSGLAAALHLQSATRQIAVLGAPLADTEPDRLDQVFPGRSVGISHREKSGFPHPDRHRHGLNGGRDRPPTCLYDCRHVGDVAQAGGQRVDRQTDVVP